MALSTRGITHARATSPPSATPITINFGTTSFTIDATKSFGHCVTGYTGDGGDIRANSTIQAYETALAPGLYRLAFKWDSTNSYPINGAASGVGLGDDWVAGINVTKPAGGEILGIIEGDVTVSGSSVPENGCTPADAANIVHYYNDNGGQHGGPITYWVIGNEPDLVGSSKYDYLGRNLHDGRTYGDTWLQLYETMKAADPTIKIGGPTASQFSGHIQTTVANATSPGAITQFWNDFLLSNRSGVGTVADLIDFMDYHFYGTGNSNESTSTVMARITLPFGEIPNARTVLNAYSTGRGTNMPVIVSEYNWAYRPNDGRPDLVDDFGTNNDGRFIMAVNTVWTAGYMLNILRAAGWGTFFGDVVGPLGMYTRNASGDNMVISGATHHYPHGKPFGTPYPSYYGLGMWTGMALFRRFGSTIVTTSGSAANMQVLAASGGGNVGDVMIINRDEAATRNLTLTTNGISNGTTVDVWSTNRYAPWDPPTKVRTMTVSAGTISGLLVPPMTVMRLVIG
jgi:hypothetical protein